MSQERSRMELGAEEVKRKENKKREKKEGKKGKKKNGGNES